MPRRASRSSLESSSTEAKSFCPQTESTPAARRGRLSLDQMTILVIWYASDLAFSAASATKAVSVSSGQQWLMINGSNNWIYDDFNSVSVPSGTSEVSPASNPDSQWLISKN
jgi:hypothetical protein